MGITDQFGLFDIAAHVIPGVVVLSAIGWVVADQQGGLPEMPGEFVVATVGLVLAYVAGQLCQLLADTGLGRLVLKGPRLAAESEESRQLDEAGDREPVAAPGTRGFPDALRDAVEKHLGLRVEREGERPEEETWKQRLRVYRTSRRKDDADKPRKARVKSRERCFRACYALLHQAGNASRPQTFKAIASFYESMAPAALAVAFAGSLVVLRSGPDLASALVILAALVSFLLFRVAYQQFDRRFVESVYFGFFALTWKAPTE
ncbi:MAG TPA: hypothetical protein VHH36_05965 [Candidatus Thermoplasmatota archaeon]|nr:hypothetical protein [Candidatus Thermoplasmatota archaeon]